jgi:hypothetical protein
MGEGEGTPEIVRPLEGHVDLPVLEGAHQRLVPPDQRPLAQRPVAFPVGDADEDHGEGIARGLRGDESPLPRQIAAPAEVTPVVIVVGGGPVEPQIPAAELDASARLQPGDHHPVQGMLSIEGDGGRHRGR